MKNTRPSRFSRDKRIRKKSEFDHLFKKGKRWFGRKINLWVAEPAGAIAIPETVTKVGIIVSKKTHPLATKRNLWKRRIRESYRALESEITGRVWIVIQAKISRAEGVKRKKDDVPDYQTIKNELKTLLDRAGLIRKENTTAEK